MAGLRRAVLPGMVVVLLALPWILVRYQLSILTDLLIFGLFALSVDLIMGYIGMVSFGHAAYFGLGAYASALLLLTWEVPMPVALVAGAALAQGKGKGPAAGAGQGAGNAYGEAHAVITTVAKR